MMYVQGDATNPTLSGKPIVIPHICNDVGKWGAGFVLGISNRCSQPEKEYRRWAADGEKYEGNAFVLGQIQCVPYRDTSLNLWVCNMIAQRGVGHYILNRGTKRVDVAPIRYTSLSECMYRLVEWIGPNDVEIHCPRFGTGLAGGDADKIEKMIQSIWVDFGGLDVTIYEFDK